MEKASNGEGQQKLATNGGKLERWQGMIVKQARMNGKSCLVIEAGQQRPQELVVVKGRPSEIEEAGNGGRPGKGAEAANGGKSRP